LYLPNYEYKGKGYCHTGYYKGWTNDADHATMDVKKCAAHCSLEPECKYFAVFPGKTCSRYNDGAGSCPKNNNKDHYLYAKKARPWLIHESRISIIWELASTSFTGMWWHRKHGSVSNSFTGFVDESFLGHEYTLNTNAKTHSWPAYHDFNVSPNGPQGHGISGVALSISVKKQCNILGTAELSWTPNWECKVAFLWKHEVAHGSHKCL